MRRTIRQTAAAALAACLLLGLLPAATFARTVPVAASFSTAVPANRQSLVQLQGSDAEGTSLTYATTSTPSHGALSNLNASTGYVVYTPTAGYTGSDSFTYTVTSGGQTSSAGTVTVSVTNAKTRVVDSVTDAGGQPRKGKVTFILTQTVTTPAGLTPVGSTVSASLNTSGQFDVSVYPSRALNPAAYYQVWFEDSSNLQRELLGVFDIPAATAAVSLSGYKVTDTNLAARYTFASLAGLEALTAAVASASLAQLVGPSRTTGKLQFWDGTNLSDSLVSQAGGTVTVAGNLAAGNVTASGSVTAGSYVGITNAALPAAIVGKSIVDPNITNASSTGGTFVGPAINNAAITGGTIAGINDLAVADGGTGASSAPAARTNLGLGTAAVLNAPASGNAAAGEVVKGSDTRLSDPRPPTTHAHAASDITSGTIPNSRTTATTDGNPHSIVQRDASGNIVGTFVGNCAGCTGITGGTGGLSNTGSSTVNVDSDGDGVGIFDEQVNGQTKRRLNNDGSTEFFGPVRFPRYARVALPLPCAAGQRADVTDSIRGEFVCNSTSDGWYSKTGRANVQDFGAKPDDAGDDTAAFQDAIQAVYDDGGGTVTGPQGSYKIAGPLDPTHHSILTLPQAPAGQAPRTIRLAGEVNERTSGSPPQYKGFVLDASERAAINPGGLSSYASVISGKIYSDTSSLSAFNYVYFEMENVHIKLAPNSYIGAIQMHNVVGAKLRNVQITNGQEAGASTITEPTHPENIGLLLPGRNNHAQVSVQGVSMWGMYTGFSASEHAHFIGDNYASYGKVCLELEAGGHLNWGKVGCEIVTTHVKRTGGGTVMLDLTLTAESDRSSGSWRQSTYEVDDPSNITYGTLRAEITQPGIPGYVSARRNGAISLEIKNLRTGRIENSLSVGGTSTYAAANGTVIGIHDNNTTAANTIQGYPAGGKYEFFLSANAILSEGVWTRFDSASTAWNMYMSNSADKFAIRRAASGSGSFTWPTEFFSINSSGNATFSGSVTNAGVVSTGVIRAQTIPTFADGATTPAVSAGNIFKASNTGATTITNFTSGGGGQVIIIKFTNNNTTVQNNANIVLAGGINFVGTTNDTLTLFWDGAVWSETGRSVN